MSQPIDIVTANAIKELTALGFVGIDHRDIEVYLATRRGMRDAEADRIAHDLGRPIRRAMYGAAQSDPGRAQPSAEPTFCAPGQLCNVCHLPLDKPNTRCTTDDHAAPPSAPQDDLVRLGNESFNIPAILRMLQHEHDGAYGGSERTQIASVMRFITAARAALNLWQARYDFQRDRVVELDAALTHVERKDAETLATFQHWIAEFNRVSAALAEREQDAARLRKAGSGLLALIDEVPVDSALGDETDRVFSRYEFDALRMAIARAPEAGQDHG